MVLFIIKLVFYFTSNTASFRLGLLLSLSKDFQSLASHSLHGGITENVENHFVESLSKNKCLITTSKVRLGQDRRFSIYMSFDVQISLKNLFDEVIEWQFWQSDQMIILTKWSNDNFDNASFDVLTKWNFRLSVIRRSDPVFRRRCRQPNLFISRENFTMETQEHPGG